MCTPAIGSIPVAFKFSFSFSIFHSFSSSLLSLGLPSFSLLSSSWFAGRNPIFRPYFRLPAIPLHLPNSINLFNSKLLLSCTTLLLHFWFFFLSSFFLIVCVCVCVCGIWCEFEAGLVAVAAILEQREGRWQVKAVPLEGVFRRRRGEPLNQGRLENQFPLRDLCMFFLLFTFFLSLILCC